MTEAIKELHSNRKYVLEELHRIREMFCSKVNFKSENIIAAKKSLSWLYIYAPKELQTLIESTRIELEMRESILFFGNVMKEKEQPTEICQCCKMPIPCNCVSVSYDNTTEKEQPE